MTLDVTAVLSNLLIDRTAGSHRTPRLISGDDRQRDLNLFGAEVY